MNKDPNPQSPDQPVVLVKWYDYTRWVLDRVDQFPKNQRFVLGTRLADAVMEVLELLSEAAYAAGRRKAELLGRANRRIEATRWLVRLTEDRNLVSKRQFAFSARSLEQPPFSPMYSAQIRSSRTFLQKQIPSSQFKSKLLAAGEDCER